MDSHVVVEVGNIYASEALFRAGVRPSTPARRLSLPRCEALACAIGETLQAAIEAGGSTLRDFVGSDGNPGYFQQNYFVYDRAGEPCRRAAPSSASCAKGSVPPTTARGARNRRHFSPQARVVSQHAPYHVYVVSGV